MENEYPQSNFYYSSILAAFILWILGLLINIYWYQPDEEVFTYIWDLWASGIVIQWIVYIFRMLEIRKQFRQSIFDKGQSVHTLYQYLFCIPWWATKIDNVAIDLIGQEYGKYIQKKEGNEPKEHKHNKTVII